MWFGSMMVGLRALILSLMALWFLDDVMARSMIVVPLFCPNGC